MILDFSDLKKATIEELRAIRHENASNPRRLGALYNATFRRFKALCIVNVIQQIIDDNDLDVSFTTANKVVFELLGHGINSKILMSQFATANRTAANKVPIEDVEQALRIAKDIRLDVLDEIDLNIEQIKEEIKPDYRQTIK